MIAAFEGWNDAGDAASTAVEHLALMWDAAPLTDFDPEPFYDFQVNRPLVTIREGVTRSIEWPTTRVTAARLPQAPHDVVLVHGIEPNLHWRAYCTELVELAVEHDVQLVVLLGALLADIAHTHPIQVTGSSYDETTAERFGLAGSNYSGPTGIPSVVQQTMVDAGVPAVSLWAAVPHYIADPPSPRAVLALLRHVEEVIDAEVPVGTLPEQAEEWLAEVNRLAAADEEISAYIHALEERDRGDSLIEPASGDIIAEEFERYLRRRRPRPGQR